MLKVCLFSVLILLAGSYMVAGEDAAEPEHSDVVVLTESNFDDLTKDGAWFVEFYAPWCGHCKKLAPTWEELATQLKGKVNIGKVDCTIEAGLARQFGVRGFPTLKLIKDGQVREFKSDRTLQALTAFVNGGFAEAATAPLPAKLSTFDKFSSDFGDALRTIERVGRDKLWYALGVAFVVGLLLGAVLFGGGSDYPPARKPAPASAPAASTSSSGATSPASASAPAPAAEAKKDK